jgi:hypothetical protein
MELPVATLTTLDVLETLAKAKAVLGYELLHTAEGVVLDALVIDDRKRLCATRKNVRIFKNTDTAVQVLLRLGAKRTVIEFI